MNDRAHETAQEREDRETIASMAKLLARTAGAWRGHLGFLKVDRLALERAGEALGVAVLRELAALPNTVGVDPDPKVIASMAVTSVRTGLAGGLRGEALAAAVLRDIAAAVLRELDALPSKAGEEEDPKAIASMAIASVRTGLAAGVRRG